MNGSTGTREKRGPYGPSNESEYRYGEHIECELCERERHCFDRFDLVACQACHDAFLPTPGFF